MTFIITNINCYSYWHPATLELITSYVLTYVHVLV